MQPPKLVVTIAPHSAIIGSDFNYDSSFGPVREVFIAEFGSEVLDITDGKPEPRISHRIPGIITETRKMTTFAINRTGLAATTTGGGTWEDPLILPVNKMKWLLGIFKSPGTKIYTDLNTGAIWRVTKL